MRLHRFYSAEAIEPAKVGTSSLYRDANQWRKVFRLKVGDQVILFDGSGFDFVCEIVGYESEGATVRVIEIVPNNVSAKYETVLCAAIVKKDTFEWIVQKATELGVSRIVPILAERSEKKNLNMERLQKIMIEAAEQSGRATLPILDEPSTLDDVIFRFSDSSQIVWDIDAPLFNVDRLTMTKSKKKIITYIGPEGGWSPKEIEFFKTKNLPIYSMGRQVLRAETAVVAALAATTLYI